MGRTYKDQEQWDDKQARRDGFRNRNRRRKREVNDHPDPRRTVEDWEIELGLVDDDGEPVDEKLHDDY